MKKIIIIATVILVVVIAGYLYFASGSSDPRTVTIKFYKQWLKQKGSPLADKLYQDNKYITPELSERVDDLVVSFVKGGIDPFLCAQDKPSEIEYALESRTENTATVMLVEKFNGSQKTIFVDLVTVDNSWQIDNIRCENFDKAEEVNLSIPAQNLVGDYIRENISSLSPEKEVLGGKFQIMSIVFEAADSALVKYEDGHNAFTARAKFSIEEAERVEIKEFQIVEN